MLLAVQVDVPVCEEVSIERVGHPHVIVVKVHLRQGAPALSVAVYPRVRVVWGFETALPKQVVIDLGTMNLSADISAWTKS